MDNSSTMVHGSPFSSAITSDGNTWQKDCRPSGVCTFHHAAIDVAKPPGAMLGRDSEISGNGPRSAARASATASLFAASRHTWANVRPLSRACNTYAG